jgi:peptidyl-prolyl cis-trans isomerase C
MPHLLRKLAQDRLIWFVVIGLALFGADRLLQARDTKVISIDLPLVEKLVAQWEGQTQRRPNARELDALIEGYIREEILVREAARLGLDTDDVIIRRRLAQKVEFMMADDMDETLPDEAVLKTFFDDNLERYNAPETLSWRHVFVDDEAQAKKLKTALAKNDDNWQERGQPFMLNREFTRQSETELSRLMGTQFAAAVFAEKAGAWRGPVQSAFGWHVVKIDTRHQATVAEFEPIIERVARDYQQAERQKALAEAWRILRTQYEVKLVPVEDEQ